MFIVFGHWFIKNNNKRNNICGEFSYNLNNDMFFNGPHLYCPRDENEFNDEKNIGFVRKMMNGTWISIDVVFKYYMILNCDLIKLEEEYESLKEL